MKSWPLVQFGEIARIIRRPVEIDQDASYPELGIRSFGKGTFHKPALSGMEVGSKRLFKIEAGDLLFSNVFAWEGAVAVAAPQDHGRFGSHRFISCLLDLERALPSFVCRYLVTPDGLEQLQKASPGGAGRNRTLGLDKLVKIKIPLPPLAAQQAIVARLDALAEKARQVTEHLDAIDQAANKLILSLHHKLAGIRTVRLSEIIELHEESVLIQADCEYSQVGVRGFGGGLFAKPAIAGIDTTYRAFNRLYANAIVLSQVKGWEGALAVCPENLDGMFVSPEYRTFRCLAGRGHPAYLGELFKTPWFWSLLQDATRGVGARRERTRPEQFLNIKLPMPDYGRQLKAAEILSRQVILKAEHTAIRQASQAIIPAMLERLFSSGSTHHG